MVLVKLGSQKIKDLLDLPSLLCNLILSFFKKSSLVTLRLGVLCPFSALMAREETLTYKHLAQVYILSGIVTLLIHLYELYLSNQTVGILKDQEPYLLCLLIHSITKSKAGQITEP